MNGTISQILSMAENPGVVVIVGLSLWEIYQNWSDNREIYGTTLLVEYGTHQLQLTTSRISFLLSSSYAYARRYWAVGNWFRVPFFMEYYPGMDGDIMAIGDYDRRETLVYLYGGQIVDINYQKLIKAI